MKPAYLATSLASDSQGDPDFLVNCDLDALRSAILAFAAEHRQRRFGVLREVGVQAALKRLVDHHLGADATVEAALVDARDQPILLPDGQPRTENTDRIRLESKILLRGDESRIDDEELEGRRGGKDDRTDLLLYRRDNVRLVMHRNGPGDIVYRSFPESVLAALEIKADPSHMSQQRQKYGSDIERLLKLRSRKVFGFFVLLDKSSPFYGHFQRRVPFKCINWEPAPGEPTSLAQILRGSNPAGIAKADWRHILVSRAEPEHREHIEIYNISVEDEAQIKYFAYADRPL